MFRLISRFIIVLPFFLLFSCYGQKSPQVDSALSVQSHDHLLWDTLLKKYVDDDGNVDYKKFSADSDQLRGYLDVLAKKPISNKASKEERLAFYINLYNAGTVLLIIEKYPLKSIKDIFRPWGKDRIIIGNDEFSLGEIEHDILRKMNEPRIHFAINCASFSCPRLLNEAFTATKMEAQLEKMSLDFINDQSKNKITSNSVQLSKIFSWYKRDFTDIGSLIDYLNTYSKINIEENAKVDYLDYDWSLNEK